MTLRLTLVLALLTSLLGIPHPGHASSDPEPAPVVPGRFAVRGSSQVSLQALGQVAQNRPLPGGWQVVEVDPATTLDQMQRRLPGAEVVPIRLLQLFGDPADEPRFPDQWNLENTGQTVGGATGTPGADIAAREAWAYTMGIPSAVVAVVDSGVELTDPELASRLWTNPDDPANGLDDDSNGLVDDSQGWDFVDHDNTPDDTVGHGTGVASVVAAAANGLAIAGVAPEAWVMAVRVCDETPQTDGCPTDLVAKGIRYAVDEGADVVNLSLGGKGSFPLIEEAVAYANDRDVLVVAAAGNGDGGGGVDVDNDDTPWSPVGLRFGNVIGVAASDQDDRLLESSNYGAESVEVAAPGVNILASVDGPGLVYWSGTSFAAPHVSGIAALMRSVDPEMPASDIVAVLRDHADASPSLADTTAGGGRVNALAGVFGARFRDIPSSVFAADIWWLADTGITQGCAEVRFCPNDSVTRGQMAAFLVRALDLEPSSQDRFTDDDSSIFEAESQALAAAGITSGCNPPSFDQFCPNDPVTRGQMAAFLVRAYGYAAQGDVDFIDDDGHIFEAEIERLAAAGVTQGCNPPTNDRFCPDQAVTRGQMAAFLHRAEG